MYGEVSICFHVLVALLVVPIEERGRGWALERFWVFWKRRKCIVPADNRNTTCLLSTLQVGHYTVYRMPAPYSLVGKVLYPYNIEPLPRTANIHTYIHTRGLSGNYQAILNISRTGRVSLIYLGSQSEEILLFICEQLLDRGASQSAVRCRLLSLCTMWQTHSQIYFLSTAILALGKARRSGELNLGCRRLTDLGDVMLCQKKALTRDVEWAGALSWWSWPARSVIVKMFFRSWDFFT
jgi:hypothetical protein